MNAKETNFGSRYLGRCVSVCAVCAALATPAFGQAGRTGAASTGKDGQEVKVSDFGTVDISVQDTDLATVLQMLSIESKKNIIAGKGVSATVTANLYDVTFEEALKAILDVNGFTFYQDGNFIYVVTKEEWDTMQKARRRTQSRIFELQHLSAADASEFIQPLLSDTGKATARGDVQPGMKPEVTDGGADGYAYNARLVVNDYPENLESISALLGEIDTPPQQVLVEATILQVAINEANAFGVDFNVIGGFNFTDLTNPISAVTNLLNGDDPRTGFQPTDNEATAVQSQVGNAGGPGGLKVGFVSNDVSVFVRVLDEVTDSQVLARPKVMALNRQRAEVLVGARVGYLSTTSTETTTTQSVQFLDTGIQLVFRPFVSKDGMIRMELKPSVSEASLRSVTDATGAVVTIPDELTNQVTTNVRIRDGMTLVLGGLFKDSSNKTRRQVPVLGDIPIVGAAFRGQDDKVERSEVIFLITPSIVKDQKLWAIGEEHLSAVDAMRIGSRAGLLPWSQDKVTSGYNQRAQQAFADGDSKLALHFIDKSLGLAPHQTEVIRLREKITGETAKFHERSMMERAFRKEMGPMVTEPAPQSAAPSAETYAAMWNSQNQPKAESWTKPEEKSTMSIASHSEPVVDSRTSSAPKEEPSNDWTQLTKPADTFSTSTAAASNDWDNADSNTNSDWNADQVAYYDEFLHDFFMAVGMPDLARTYASSSSSSDSEYPFPTFPVLSAYGSVDVDSR